MNNFPLSHKAIRKAAERLPAQNTSLEQDLQSIDTWLATVQEGMEALKMKPSIMDKLKRWMAQPTLSPSDRQLISKLYNELSASNGNT